MKVHMFTNAQNLSIQDTAIHAVGRDMTIINKYYMYYEPEPVLGRFSMHHIVRMTQVVYRSALQTFYTEGPMYFW